MFFLKKDLIFDTCLFVLNLIFYKARMEVGQTVRKSSRPMKFVENFLSNIPTMDSKSSSSHHHRHRHHSRTIHPVRATLTSKKQSSTTNKRKKTMANPSRVKKRQRTLKPNVTHETQKTPNRQETQQMKETKQEKQDTQEMKKEMQNMQERKEEEQDKQEIKETSNVSDIHDAAEVKESIETVDMKQSITDESSSSVSLATLSQETRDEKELTTSTSQVVVKMETLEESVILTPTPVVKKRIDYSRFERRSHFSFDGPSIQTKQERINKKNVNIDVLQEKAPWPWCNGVFYESIPEHPTGVCICCGEGPESHNPEEKKNIKEIEINDKKTETLKEKVSSSRSRSRSRSPLELNVENKVSDSSVNEQKEIIPYSMQDSKTSERKESISPSCGHQPWNVKAWVFAPSYQQMVEGKYLPVELRCKPFTEAVEIKHTDKESDAMETDLHAEMETQTEPRVELEIPTVNELESVAATTTTNTANATQVISINPSTSEASSETQSMDTTDPESSPPSSVPPFEKRSILNRFFSFL